MVGRLADRLGEGLAALDHENLRRRRRVLDSAQGTRVVVDGLAAVNFSSNDYLGLANHPRLRAAAHASIDEFGVGAGASPLVTGHMRVHHDAEQRFAAYCGLPRALLFGSGYAANLGIIAALCDRHAEVFADRLNHACLNDGVVLSRANFARYPHLDLDALAARLAASKAAVRLVATDTVFSMDGDIAPVAGLLELCERHDAWLLLDDAHGMGVLGSTGRGALEHFGVSSPRIVYMATLGKALGGYGAFVAGAPETIEWLVQRARTYIYSTALPPMAAAASIAAIDLLQGDPAIVPRLHQRIAQFRDACGGVGLRLAPSTTAIQPLILGDAGRALNASQRLLERGFLVPAIRPPTVPEGTSRLRVSLSAAHSREDVEGLACALDECLAS
ncbi:MAG: 8-amino-7-oxononanoate synthase [Usitatibacter sp.]